MSSDHGVGAISLRRARWGHGETAFWLVAVASIFLLSDRYLILTEMAWLGLFALSLDLILGYAGIVSLGHAAFFGIGAYTAGLLAVHGLIREPVLALLVAGLAAMVLGFILFWPIGLAILFFMIGSGRMGRRWVRRYGMGPGGSAPNGDGGWGRWCRDEQPSSGNAAFDEYRLETLRRLEEEQKDFAAFLERLRFAKDRAEFEQFMSERRRRPPETPDGQPQQG